jgi:predicted RNA-binding Zn ribbon-like protein
VKERPHQFELVGGHPALDFLNTVQDWITPEAKDYLSEFGDAVRFGEKAGLLSRGEAAHPRRPEDELARLRELRALLKQIFEMRIAGKTPELGGLSADFAEASRATQLMAGQRRRIRLEITEEKAGEALLRFRIVKAAVDLLVSDSMSHVKSCPSCGWFFLDVSKNHSRRWCSMKACGAAAKAHSYYWRLKQEEGS